MKMPASAQRQPRLTTLAMRIKARFHRTILDWASNPQSLESRGDASQWFYSMDNIGHRCLYYSAISAIGSPGSFAGHRVPVLVVFFIKYNMRVYRYEPND